MLFWRESNGFNRMESGLLQFSQITASDSIDLEMQNKWIKMVSVVK